MNHHITSLKKHILLVEDDTFILKLLSSFLKQQGFELSCASSAEEAKLFFKLYEMDALIIDVQLPDVSGFELYTTLNKRSKLKSDLDIPIIYMSGAKIDMESIQEGYDHGAQDYILKPFEPAMLLNKLKVLLEMSTRIKELEYVVEEKIALEEELLHLDNEWV